MEKDKVVDMVREEIRKQVMGNMETPVNESYEHQGIALLESHSHEIQESVLEEGLGSGLLKAFGLYAGASIGSSLVGGFGYLSGIALGSVLAAVGLIGATTLVPIAMAGGLTGAAYGLYKGGSLGLDVARRASKKDHERVIEKLIEVTNKRDDEIKKVGSETENQEKVQKNIDSLTQKQQQLGDKLLKELAFSQKKGFIDTTELDALTKIATVAKQGKFTYLYAKK
jgi:hypothetical protein